jgi:hypothetical protein
MVSKQWFKNKNSFYAHLFSSFEEMYPGASCDKKSPFRKPRFYRTAPFRMHGAVLTFFEGAFNGE